MLDYRLSRDEQELTLTVTRSDDVVTVYTSDRVHMRQLDKLCAQYPGVYVTVWTDKQTMGDGLPLGRRYTFPRRYLRFGHPATDAQRAAARANMFKINSAAEI